MTHKGKEIKIVYIPFPEEIRGTCGGFLLDAGPCWKIVIDASRHEQAKRYTLGHELAHLFLDHFDQHDRDIREQEQEANRSAWHFYREYKAGRLGLN